MRRLYTLIAITLLATALGGCKSLNTAIAPIDNSSQVNNYYYYYGDGNTTTTNNGVDAAIPNKTTRTKADIQASSLTRTPLGSTAEVVQMVGIALQLAHNSRGITQPGQDQADIALPLAAGNFARFRWSTAELPQPQPPAASGTLACSIGGEIHYGNASMANPHSPFAAGNFNLQPATYADCHHSTVSAAATRSGHYTGISLSGCPADDPGCSHTGYMALGSADALFYSDLSASAGQASQTAQVWQISRVDSQRSPQGQGWLMLQEQMGEVSYQTDNAPNAPAASAHYDAMLGHQAEPFALAMSADGSQITLNGPFAFASSLPDCASGSARITSLVPLSVNATGQLIGGSLRIGNGQTHGNISIHADGSWLVTLADGHSAQLLPADLATASAACSL